jgi:hypothetical protein
MLVRAMHEVYSIIETVFSKTGSFARSRPVERNGTENAASAFIQARYAKRTIFIGVMAKEEFEVRLAAD